MKRVFVFAQLNVGAALYRVMYVRHFLSLQGERFTGTKEEEHVELLVMWSTAIFYYLSHLRLSTWLVFFFVMMFKHQ